MSILAFDTSNYTTSVAFYSENHCQSLQALLRVPSGELGLRQQEALFQHTKKLPQLLEQLKETCDLSTVDGIAVSTKPRETEDSYMPCFLAGESLAKSFSTVLNVPLYEVSHQQGHIASALWSLGKLELLEKPLLVWHLSGGTTELLLVKPKGNLVEATCVGGSSDISAGQLIDRTGLLLGQDFPAGKAVDAFALSTLSGGNPQLPPFPLKSKNLMFSLSGMENKVQTFRNEGHSPEDISRFVLETLGIVLEKVSFTMQQEFFAENLEKLPVVFSGGVASSGFLRQYIKEGLFPEPRYATDNAMGVAVLGNMLKERLC